MLFLVLLLRKESDILREDLPIKFNIFMGFWGFGVVRDQINEVNVHCFRHAVQEYGSQLEVLHNFPLISVNTIIPILPALGF